MKGMSRNKWIRSAVCICLIIVVAVSGISPAMAKSKGYTFKSGGVTISPGDKATKFLEKNKYKKKTTANSCATKGYDYTYTYSGFVLTTCTNNKKKNATEYVSSIRLTSKSVKTAEGIKIGSTEKQVKKKYKGGTMKYGVFTKTKGKSKITIDFKNGKVSSILITKK